RASKAAARPKKKRAAAARWTRSRSRVAARAIAAAAAATTAAPAGCADQRHARMTDGDRATRLGPHFSCGRPSHRSLELPARSARSPLVLAYLAALWPWIVFPLVILWRVRGSRTLDEE